MKFLPALLVVALLQSATTHAAENRYDVFSKTLAPFIGVLAQSPKGASRAIALRGVLERMTGVAPALVGTAVELAAQNPDRLRLRGPLLGEMVTVCRDGQQVWATPGAKIGALLDAAKADKKLPKPDPDAHLGAFELPFPEKQLVFLPALFQVKDAGSEAVGAVECRVLDVALMPELDKKLTVRGWAARAWVRPDYRLARLVVSRPGWELAVRFEDVAVASKLPEETWQAPASDALQLDAPRFRQLLQALGK